MYPNPVHDVLFIKSENREIEEAKIYELTGKLILQFFIENSEGEINLHELEKGIYFLSLQRNGIKLIVK